MTPTIAAAIPHADWAPRRKTSLACMRAIVEPGVARYLEYPNRSPCNEWAGHIMAWGAAQPTTHFAVLQDDLLLPEHFAEDLHALVGAMPDDVIGLHTIHPKASELARCGARWCSTADGLVGPQYVFPQAVLHAFLVWRETALSAGWQAITEDTLIDVWALSTGRRIVHPIPAIADHDNTMPSTWGNAGHLGVCVRWDEGRRYGWSEYDLADVSFWRSGDVPHLGRYFCATAGLGEKWVKDWPSRKTAAVGGARGVR